jgi:dTDP-4-dehydrorhamnose 3,5-epimerase
MSQPRVIERAAFFDNRGYFLEALKDPYKTLPGFEVRQVNVSWSKPGVFRGLHAQTYMDKAMMVTSGHALIFAVNIDADSQDFGKVVMEELKAGDGRLFYAPWWWARGFIALDETTVTYFCSRQYRPEDEIAVNYKSFPEVIGAVSAANVSNISDKDKESPLADKEALREWRDRTA